MPDFNADPFPDPPTWAVVAIVILLLCLVVLAIFVYLANIDQSVSPISILVQLVQTCWTKLAHLYRRRRPRKHGAYEELEMQGLDTHDFAEYNLPTVSANSSATPSEVRLRKSAETLVEPSPYVGKMRLPMTDPYMRLSEEEYEVAYQAWVKNEREVTMSNSQEEGAGLLATKPTRHTGPGAGFRTFVEHCADKIVHWSRDKIV